MKKYWFYLEPYTYTSFSKDKVLLYNTLDGKYLMSDDTTIYDIILQIKNSSEGIINLDQEQVEDILSNFILQVRNYFMGDIIDTSISQGIPIQFSPILNIQNDVFRMSKTAERSIGEDVMLNLNGLIFYIDNPSCFPNKYYPSNLPLRWNGGVPSNFKYIESILQQVPHSISENLTLSFIINDITELVRRDSLIKLLGELQFKKNIHLYYKNQILDSMLCVDKLSVTLNIDFPLDDKRFDEAYKKLNKNNSAESSSRYIFFISSHHDMKYTEQIIDEYKIQKYTLIPLYTGSNYRFFEENVFINQDDLLSEPVSMRKIFLHQSLNTEYFGKLHISPIGDVFSSLSSSKLGNINQDSLLELLHKEFASSQSWLKIRDYAPCSNCHFQWLCPSPSSYESILGKKNLCHIDIK